MTTPIILFSDHPAGHSGLARITRDHATRIHNELFEDFRVATLGYGSPGSISLPFPQYHWRERDDFLPIELMTNIVKDFCGDDPFVLMTIGDVQRFLPLADPSFCRESGFADWLKRMRTSGQMKLWGYFPIDAHGRDGKLGPQLGHILSHYDRRIVPSEWAKEIVRRTLPNHSCDALPHGIDREVFKPREREFARDEFGARLANVIVWPNSPMDIPDDALWIGIVATNQSRKDWGLAMEIVSELKKTRPIALWCHVDRLKSDYGWSILELLSDSGLITSSIVTMGNVSDTIMAYSYSACDLTLGIGRGEGFGYPIFESIFCGVPCYSGYYGAQSEWMDDLHLATVDHLRLEGPMNLLRPIYKVSDWMFKLNQRNGMKPTPPSELDWANLWPRWAEWFRKGIS